MALDYCERDLSVKATFLWACLRPYSKITEGTREEYQSVRKLLESCWSLAEDRGREPPISLVILAKSGLTVQAYEKLWEYTRGNRGELYAALKFMGLLPEAFESA